jgi:hypothetical protein
MLNLTHHEVAPKVNVDAENQCLLPTPQNSSEAKPVLAAIILSEIRIRKFLVLFFLSIN